MLAECLQLVILVVIEACPDHTKEQIALFLLLDQLFKSAPVRDAEIQIPVCDQDHLVVAVLDIFFFTDLVSRLDSGGAIGAAVDLKTEECLKRLDLVLFSELCLALLLVVDETSDQAHEFIFRCIVLSVHGYCIDMY